MIFVGCCRIHLDSVQLNLVEFSFTTYLVGLPVTKTLTPIDSFEVGDHFPHLFWPSFLNAGCLTRRKKLLSAKIFCLHTAIFGPKCASSFACLFFEFDTSLVEKSKLAFQSKAFIVASAIENVPPELSVWEYLEGTLQNQFYQPQVEKLSLLRVRAKERQNLD